MTVHVISGIKMRSVARAAETPNKSKKAKVLKRKTLNMRVLGICEIGDLYMVTGDTFTWDGLTLTFDEKTFTPCKEEFLKALNAKKIGI
jgi:hypothetical protein